MHARPLLSVPSSLFHSLATSSFKSRYALYKLAKANHALLQRQNLYFHPLTCNVSRRPIFPVAVDNENAESELSESNDGSTNLLRRPASLPPPENIKISQDKGEEDDRGEEEEEDEGDALAPFLKFFRPRGSSHSSQEMDAPESTEDVERTAKAVDVEYYEPKAGDFIIYGRGGELMKPKPW